LEQEVGWWSVWNAELEVVETGKVGRFRFESLEIWQRAADVDLRLFRVADYLEDKRKYRFAEQLRAAALSITNNIAEGSGSDSDADFARFISFARKSTFECASMLIMFQRDNLLAADRTDDLLDELEQLSRMQTAFKKTLRSK
jgi:four helix bundle protein